MMMPERRKAFTLIELLVVIAIVALLLAILSPALSRAKEHMKFLRCKTNLKAYHIGMKLYLEANDARFHVSHTSLFDGTLTGYTGVCQWHDERISPSYDKRNAGPLWAYLDSPKLHLCPTFVPFAVKYGPEHPGHNSSIPIKPQYSYSQNHFLGGLRGTEPLAVAKESEVVNPGGVLLWVEETIWTIVSPPAPATIASHVLNDTCFMARHPRDPFGQVGDCIATYHNTVLQKRNEGLGNAVFVDGHVELCDAWDIRETPNGRFNPSYYRAWPKRGAFSQNCPY